MDTWKHNHNGQDVMHEHEHSWPPHSGGPHAVNLSGTWYNGPAWGKDERPWRWLESTRELQAKHYKDGDPWLLEGDARADFITWNMAALLVEVGEFSREVGWKPWAADRGWTKAAALDELVDVGHFLGNLLAALQVTDGEWESAYRRKQRINRDRMLAGDYLATGTQEGERKR